MILEIILISYAIFVQTLLVENKYDKIICIAILEHVYDPFKAVANLRKMLKENGKIYGMVPIYITITHRKI